MGWRLAADVVLLVHLAFVLVVAVGGFVCWRWPRFAWVQLPAAAHGVVIQLVGFTCPLTPIEKSLRRRAGEAGYDGGFVEHYIVGLLYPGEFTPTVAALLATGVIAANAVAYGVVLARRRRSPQPTG